MLPEIATACERLFQAEPAYFLMAGIGTTLFLIKLAAPLASGSDDGGLGHAPDASDADFKIFSLQSILALVMGAGWTGLAARQELGLGSAAALGAATGFGVTMLLFSAAIAFQLRKLNRVKSYDLASCVGTNARVYLPVPEKGQGFGEVEVDVSGRRRIVKASSTSDAITAFAPVRVVAVGRDKESVVVRVIEKD